QPEQMATAIARHDTLLASAVRSHRGRVIKTTGDGIHATFADAVDALDAVIAMQISLADPAATAGVTLRVRCGLHAGDAQERELEATPNNLPQQITSFIGRRGEREEAQALLTRTRLLTLLGMGGLGKTRLSLQIATDVMDGYPDGVWFVDLAPITDPSLIASEAAQVLGVREEPGRPLTQTLCAHVKPRKLLLILDNCEHLINESASLANALLKAAADIRIIATSRQALHVP